MQIFLQQTDSSFPLVGLGWIPEGKAEYISLPLGIRKISSDENKA